MTLPVTIQGTVRKYKGRGKNLGFPTANIPVDTSVEDGLYVGYTTVDGKRYPSLIFVGVPITYTNDTKRRAEMYLLDVDIDLYGKILHIEITKKLRENIKFESEGALIAQMKRDEQSAREYFTLVK